MRTTRYFRCTGCGYGFKRVIRANRKKVTCPKCHNRFAVPASQTDDEVAAIQQEHAERKRAGRAAFFTKFSAAVVGPVIRGAQVPASRAEAVFKSRCLDRGWKPHRPSWPDFLVETNDGVIAVEVKANDAVSVTQVLTFDLLESIGVPVYLWRMKNGVRHVLMRWDAGKGRVRIEDAMELRAALKLARVQREATANGEAR